MMTYKCDVLLLGDYFCDLIFTGLPEAPRIGAEIFGSGMEIAPGGAYILAVAFQRLGVNLRWAARFGNDLFSQFAHTQTQKEGLNPALFEYLDQPYRVVSCSFSFTHDRGFISYTDSLPARDPFDLVDSAAPRWVVNTPFDGSAHSLELLRHIHQSGGKVLADCQYTSLTLQDTGIRQYLQNVDIFAPNESEACQLTGAADAQAATRILADYCPFVLVKAGANGCFAQAGTECWHSPAIKVTPIDTTGAGDSFNAGFLTGIINGQPVPTCLRYGNICGGLSVTMCGGASAAPTLAELKNHLLQEDLQ